MDVPTSPLADTGTEMTGPTVPRTAQLFHVPPRNQSPQLGEERPEEALSNIAEQKEGRGEEGGGVGGGGGQGGGRCVC